MNYKIEKNKVMSKEEIKTIFDELQRKAKRSPNTKLNEIIFRLATVCGLRASEIANLQVRDVRLNESGRTPFIHVRNGKGGKSGDVTIPDAPTSVLLAQFLTDKGKIKPTTYFVHKLNGKKFDRQEIAKRFKSAIKCLPQRRQKELSVHCGRHTAATMLLRATKDISIVRDFCRHSNVSVTNMYAHADEIKPTDMYAEDIDVSPVPS